MKKLMVLAMCVAITGCAWFKANGAALSADSLQLVSCVINAAKAGEPVETVALTCGVSSVLSVVQLLDAAAVVPVPSPGLTAARLSLSTMTAGVK